LGRVGPEKTGDFAKLVIVEAHRNLRSALPWYEELAASEDEQQMSREAAARELQSLRLAIAAIEKLARDEGFVAPMEHSSSKPLEMLPEVCRRRVDETETSNLLVQLFSSMIENFGSAIVILDQFEEILNDPTLGRQAVLAVESTYKLQGAKIGQMISMREDSSHLLRPLVERGTLGDKRMQNIQPLNPSAVRSIVEQVGSDLGVRIEDSALGSLVEAFTDSADLGSGRQDVNLLGLQVVLKSLFAGIPRPGTLDMAAVAAYCADMACSPILSSQELAQWLKPYADQDEETGLSEMVRARLAQEAPKRWIARTLRAELVEEGQSALPERISAADYVEALVQPMVARMAAWLVTPSGFKRPMTFGELEHIAFDLPKATGDLSGSAWCESWKLDRVSEVLKNTFRVALHRLTELGNVLKIRGTERDASYELVHDQFGKPFQSWADEFRRTPEANIGALCAMDDVVFPWGRDSDAMARVQLAKSLRIPSDAACPTLSRTKWRGCAIRGVDFSGLRLEHCDLSRTAFTDCSFDVSTSFVDSELVGAIFRACRFVGTHFDHCILDSIAIANDCTLDGVTVKGGSLRFADIRGCHLSDCHFSGSLKSLLAMRNINLVNCVFVGTTTFEDCSLDGATLGAEEEIGDDGQPTEVVALTPEDISFTRCDMKGAELSFMHFGRNSLRFKDTTARGAVFKDLSFDRRPHDEVAVHFDGIDLTGAVFIGCELRHAMLAGSGQLAVDESSTLNVARTVVMKDGPNLPMVLDDVRFKDLDMENFSLENCTVEGPIGLDACKLSGGTIRSARGSVSKARTLRGSLTFENGCDLTALEFNGLDFTSSSLVVRDCAAASLYFEDVRLPSTGNGSWRAEFAGCHMPGVLFQFCDVHGLWVHGTNFHPEPKAPTFIVRGGHEAGSFGDCRFEDTDLENFTFEAVVIDGPIEFVRCKLSGGTLAGLPADRESGCLGEPLRIKAWLTFSHGCDLAAVEFESVAFEGGGLVVTDSSCNGMLLRDVDASTVGDKAVMTFDRTTLAGAVVLNSRIHGLRVQGQRVTRDLSSCQGLTIRSTTDRSAALGDAVFANLNLDGLVLENVSLTGRVCFPGCSLLRSRFAGLQRKSADGIVDLTDSDLLYADVDHLLRGEQPIDGRDDGRLLKMLSGQWEAAEEAARGRKFLRFG